MSNNNNNNNNPRLRQAKLALGEELFTKVRSLRALVVGAGGIGSELLKDLALSGLDDITVVDLDTIDISNLNRQFLFHKEHVGLSKADIAKQSILKFNPHITKLEAYQRNIKDLDIFSPLQIQRKFDLIFSALDNELARRYLNVLAFSARVPLFETGTQGYRGQSYTVLHGLTECRHCQKPPEQKVFPTCSIRHTPEKPEHCVVYAKHVFETLFGEKEADADQSTEASENSEDSNFVVKKSFYSGVRQTYDSVIRAFRAARGDVDPQPVSMEELSSFLNETMLPPHLKSNLRFLGLIDPTENSTDATPVPQDGDDERTAAQVVEDRARHNKAMLAITLHVLRQYHKLQQIKAVLNVDGIPDYHTTPHAASKTSAELVADEKTNLQTFFLYDALHTFFDYFIADIWGSTTFTGKWVGRKLPINLDVPDVEKLLEYSGESCGDTIFSPNTIYNAVEVTQHQLLDVSDYRTQFVITLRDLLVRQYLLGHEQRVKQEQQKQQHADVVSLSFDKDDALAMTFVSTCASLRMYMNHIPMGSFFQNKGIAGNIIHAIATTNALSAAFSVTHCLSLFLRDSNSTSHNNKNHGQQQRHHHHHQQQQDNRQPQKKAQINLLHYHTEFLTAAERATFLNATPDQVSHSWVAEELTKYSSAFNPNPDCWCTHPRVVSYYDDSTLFSHLTLQQFQLLHELVIGGLYHTDGYYVKEEVFDDGDGMFGDSDDDDGEEQLDSKKQHVEQLLFHVLNPNGPAQDLQSHDGSDFVYFESCEDLENNNNQKGSEDGDDDDDDDDFVDPFILNTLKDLNINHGSVLSLKAGPMTMSLTIYTRDALATMTPEEQAKTRIIIPSTRLEQYSTIIPKTDVVYKKIMLMLKQKPVLADVVRDVVIKKRGGCGDDNIYHVVVELTIQTQGKPASIEFFFNTTHISTSAAVLRAVMAKKHQEEQAELRQLRTLRDDQKAKKRLLAQSQVTISFDDEDDDGPVGSAPKRAKVEGEEKDGSDQLVCLVDPTPQGGAATTTPPQQQQVANNNEIDLD